ncbi:MAG TPA: patatin-like phospholipase family protein [Terriglobales bacterium]|nr:patatin-like phospholipase family protein [Terriglobales bacterium]
MPIRTIARRHPLLPVFSKTLFAGIALLLAFVMTAPQGFGAESRSRIGLALSGGGARGLAHIGVLKWMEENRIPVDRLAGTSMGGLVGAMYAEGMTPAEMEAFLKTIDWDEVLLPEPTYENIAFRRKQDKRDYTVDIPLGLRHGLSVPNGFNPGHGVGLLFDRITLPYSALTNFDELPIPFRCVATDLLQAESVTLDGRGMALPQALRATMSIPGVFTPLEAKGTVLADGFLMKNIPTDVVRDMGADVVIAVDVGTPLANLESLNSIAGVLEQSITVMTIEYDRRALRSADIVIAPDLQSYTVTDYLAAEKLIQLGYDGAAQKAAVLRPFALSEEAWKEHLAARYARKRSVPQSLSPAKVVGTEGRAQHEVELRIRKYTREKLDLPGLETELTKITGEGRFDRLGYQEFLTDSTPGLEIRAHQKTYAPPLVSPTLDVEGSNVHDFRFTTGFRVTAMDVLTLGSEWRNDVRVGSDTFLQTEFYQPIAQSKFFFAPRAFFQKTARDIILSDTLSSTFTDQRYGGAVDLGYTSRYRNEVRVGYQITQARLKPLIGNLSFPPFEGYSDQVRLGWIFDGQDSATIPSRGSRIDSEVVHIFRSPDVNYAFNQAQVRSSHFIPISPKGSIFLIGSIGTSFGDAAAPLQFFSLGGPYRLDAYNLDEFLGSNYLLAGGGYRREIGRLPQLIGKKVYATGYYETGNTFLHWDQIDLKHSFSGGVIADTIFGPVSLSANVSADGRFKLRFALGRPY